MGAVSPNFSTVRAGEGLHVSAFSFHLNFKFQGSVAIAKSTVVKKRIYIILYFEIYGATGGGVQVFQKGSVYFSTLLKK